MSDLLRALRHTTIFGQPATQYWVDVVLWEHFFTYNEVRCIIELGTGTGGMSLVFALHAKQRGTQFYTFDTKRWAEYLDLPLAHEFVAGSFFALDVFSEGGRERILDLLGAPSLHPLLLYCDNGDKRREMAEYVPHLLEGDYVGVHDWPNEFGPEDAAKLSRHITPLYHDEAERLNGLTRIWEVQT